NFYGTPKPSAEPSALLLNVTDQLLPGARPSSEGKRKRNKSVSNMEKASIEPPEEEEEEKPIVNGNSVAVTPESSEHEDKSTDASGDVRPQSNPVEAPAEVHQEDGQSPKMVVPKPEENDELGPLPDNWEMAYTEKGEVYFIEVGVLMEGEPLPPRHHGNGVFWLLPSVNFLPYIVLYVGNKSFSLI
ncbi:Membrane-associated guanylate kinase, WW and PDZ domain-containing protein 2, partial [Ilyodon furcidens]